MPLSHFPKKLKVGATRKRNKMGKPTFDFKACPYF
jgi:hypothetical protein